MFVLPTTTIVNKVVPKNSFDAFTTSKQKKLFTEYIDKIKWANKLSIDTIRLGGKEVKEIQVFEIQLKKKTSSEELLNIVDRYIPYHIIFVVAFESEVLFSTSQKHANPLSENSSVIDWRFNSKWYSKEECPFKLNLKISLDEVFSDFCFQLAGQGKNGKTLSEIIQIAQARKVINAEINKLEGEIKNTRQFNKKVELNLKLQGRKDELQKLV